MSPLELVRERFSCLDVAEELGLEVNSQDKTYCILGHDENTPSLQLYEDHWFAFCCGEGGDVVELVKRFYDCDFRRAMNWFEMGDEDWEDRPKVRRTEQREVQDLRPALDAKEVHWTPAHTDFVYRRWGLSSWGYSVDGGIAIPHIHDGVVTGIKYRWFNGQKSSEDGSVFTVGLYSNQSLPSSATVAVLCEGESDSAAVRCALWKDWRETDVYGLPAGASTWRDSWLTQLEPYDTVWVCMDNDRAGMNARDKIIRAVGYGRARELKVPGLYNDAAEALMAGWQPEL